MSMSKAVLEQSEALIEELSGIHSLMADLSALDPESEEVWDEVYQISDDFIWLGSQCEAFMNDYPLLYEYTKGKLTCTDAGCTFIPDMWTTTGQMVQDALEAILVRTKGVKNLPISDAILENPTAEIERLLGEKIREIRDNGGIENEKVNG